MRSLAGSAVVFLLMFCTFVQVRAQGQPVPEGETFVFEPFDFDSTLCGTTKCTDFVLRNLGDSAITIIDVTPIRAPFHGEFDLPLTLEPGEETTVQLCYRPLQAVQKDSLVVSYEAHIIERQPEGQGGTVFEERFVSGVFGLEGRPVAAEQNGFWGPRGFGIV